MLSSDDWEQMAADLAEVRGDNEISIVIRRGNTTLAAQRIRIARLMGRDRNEQGQGTQAAWGRVVVMGGTDLDIQSGDRFNDADGILYRVVIVRPNRKAAVIADAEVVQ